MAKYAPNFESFLQETHEFLFPDVASDKVEDHYEGWVGDLSAQEMFEYAEQWGRQIIVELGPMV